MSLEEHLKFFYDRECTVEMASLTFPEDSAVRAGLSGQEIRYIKNVKEDKIIRLKLISEDSSLTIQTPPTIVPGQVNQVVFTWSPPANRKVALKTPIKIVGDRIIMP